MFSPTYSEFAVPRETLAEERVVFTGTVILPLTRGP